MLRVRTLPNPAARRRISLRSARRVAPRLKSASAHSIVPDLHVRGVMNDYGYRYFHPELGRWISRDPIGEEGGLNLYVFVGNRSLDNKDILGLVMLLFENLGCHKTGRTKIEREDNVVSDFVLSALAGGFKFRTYTLICSCEIKCCNGISHWEYEGTERFDDTVGRAIKPGGVVIPSTPIPFYTPKGNYNPAPSPPFVIQIPPEFSENVRKEEQAKTENNYNDFSKKCSDWCSGESEGKTA